MDAFSPLTRDWFSRTFAAPTKVQELGWAHIARGEHVLLVAPTGSGKTLAAFLYCIDRLSALPPTAAEGVRVLYVSPLKALVYDIDRNLRAPLEGLRLSAQSSGAPWRVARVAVRTGDTSARERRVQARSPADILVTTPESLYLLLASAAREGLRTVETVIVDEVHALAPNKRGAHLALSLERLAALTARDPQRIGLSATAHPASEVARFLGGDRPVSIVDVSGRPYLDLAIAMPTSAPADLGPGAAPSPPAEERTLWPAIYRQLSELVAKHQSTIIFVNSRGLCERLCRKLNELSPSSVVRAHHGSIAREERERIETALKAGQLRAIVATSSLELGIDMGAVDLVVLLESPGSVARGLQRVGRAGHQVGAQSKGRIVPKHPADLIECTVLAERMRAGLIEPLSVPNCPLDVLAQQLVAMCSVEPWTVADAEKLARRTASYRTLSRELLSSVLDMLSGRYPSTELADLRRDWCGTATKTCSRHDLAQKPWRS